MAVIHIGAPSYPSTHLARASWAHHAVAGQSSDNAQLDQEYIDGIKSLADKCVLPETGEKYVTSLKTGRENSGLPFNRNLQLIFVFEFEVN